jgi:hypothetical protein
MKSYKVRIIQGLPPDNQVPGPVSYGKGHSTRKRPGKGHSTLQLPGQDHSTLVTRPAHCQTRDTSRSARVTRLWVTQSARVSARVTQPASCWDRITRPWVTRPVRCQAKDKSHRARVIRLWVTQPTRISARVTQPTSCRDRATQLLVTRPAHCYARS